MLRFLSRFLAVLLALGFILVAVVLLFVRPMAVKLPEAQTYKDVLESEGIYERFPALAADAITRGLRAASEERAAEGAERSAAGFAAELDAADWEALLGTLMPPDVLRPEVESGLDQFFAFFESEAPLPSVEVALAGIKGRLVGIELQAVYMGILNGKPPCLGEAPSLPTGCRPAMAEIPRVLENFRAMTRTLADAYPDSVDLFAGLRAEGMASESAQVFQQIRDRVRQLEWLAYWGLVVAGALLALVVVFAVRSFRGLLLWWGVPCLIAGAIGAFLSLPALLAGSSTFSRILLAQLPEEVPVAAFETVVGLLAAALRQVFVPALTTSGWLAGGGLLAIIVAMMIPAPRKPQTAAV